MPCEICGTSNVSGKCADCRRVEELETRGDGEHLGARKDWEPEPASLRDGERKNEGTHAQRIIQQKLEAADDIEDERPELAQRLRRSARGDD